MRPLTNFERNTLIRGLNEALITKISALRPVKEILSDTGLTFDDLIGHGRTNEIDNRNELNIKEEKMRQELNKMFAPPTLALAAERSDALNDELSNNELINNDELPNTKHSIRPTPDTIIINDLEYISQNFDLLTTGQQIFIDEKFTSRSDNYITRGSAPFSPKQLNYIQTMKKRIEKKKGEI